MARSPLPDEMGANGWDDVTLEEARGIIRGLGLSQEHLIVDSPRDPAPRGKRWSCHMVGDRALLRTIEPRRS